MNKEAIIRGFIRGFYKRAEELTKDAFFKNLFKPSARIKYNPIYQVFKEDFR